MTPEQFVAVVKAIAELLGVLVWPAILIYVLYRFRTPLSDFFSNLGEFTFKAPGMEATAKRKQVVEAAAAFGAAVASRPGDGARPETVIEEARAAAGVLVDAVTSPAYRDRKSVV